MAFPCTRARFRQSDRDAARRTILPSAPLPRMSRTDLGGGVTIPTRSGAPYVAAVVDVLRHRLPSGRRRVTRGPDCPLAPRPEWCNQPTASRRRSIDGSHGIQPVGAARIRPSLVSWPLGAEKTLTNAHSPLLSWTTAEARY